MSYSEYMKQMRGNFPDLCEGGREWQKVSRGYPPERAVRRKDPDQSWIVYDGDEVFITSVHPAWWNADDKHSLMVTHWMPLPDAPKGDA